MRAMEIQNYLEGTSKQLLSSEARNCPRSHLIRQQFRVIHYALF